MEVGQERWLRVTTALAARPGTAPTPMGLCTACAEVLAVGGAGLVLMDDDGTPLATYTSSVQAEILEELQFMLGVGPGFDAYRQGVPIIESDLVARPPARWLGVHRTGRRRGDSGRVRLPAPSRRGPHGSAYPP